MAGRWQESRVNVVLEALLGRFAQARRRRGIKSFRPCLSWMPSTFEGELVRWHISRCVGYVFGKCTSMALSSQVAFVLLLPLLPSYADPRSILCCDILCVTVLRLLDLALLL